MKNKHLGIVVLITALSTATYFIVKKFITNKKKRKDVLIESAKTKYLNKDYSGAVKDYEELLDTLEDKTDAYNGISMCFIKLKRYEEALTNLNKSLECKVKDNVKALRWRSECYKLLGNKKAYFKDLALKYKILGKHEEPIEELKISLLKEDTVKFIKNNHLPPSKILFSDFFASFGGVLEEDDLSLEIKQKNYEVLNLKLMSSNWEKSYKGNKFLTVKVARSCLFYLKEMFIEASECCEAPSNLLESLLKELFNFYAFQIAPDVLIFNKKEIEKSNNQTLIFYLAKLFLKINNTEEYLRLLKLISSYSFVNYELLLFYKERELDYTSLELRKSLRTLVFLGEEALKKGNKESLKTILSQMDDADPRCLLFKAEFSYARNDLDYTVLMLRKAIKLDPTCFKAYFNLGGILSQRYPDKSRSIWREVLSKASNYSEVLIIMHIFLCLECKEHIEKYLFINED